MLLAALLVAPALAQDAGGADAHGFRLAPLDGDVGDGIVVPRPGRYRPGDGYAAALLDHAVRPVVRVDLDSEGRELGTEAVVGWLTAASLSLGIAAHERARVTVAAPLFLASHGVEGTQGPGLGDLRVGAELIVVRPREDGGLGLSVDPFLVVPTGDAEAFRGAAGLGGGGAVTAGYTAGPLAATASVGVLFTRATEVANITGSDALLAAGAVSWTFVPHTSAAVEITAQAPFSASTQPGTMAPIELLASARHRTDAGVFFTGGVAAGLSRGIGAPAFRVFAGGGFALGGADGPARTPRVKDADNDGIVDREDLCPEVAETVNGLDDDDGCPEDVSPVQIVVWNDGAPAVGVYVELVGDDGATRGGATTREGWRVQLPHGSRWSVRAAAAPCLGGNADLVVSDRGESGAAIDLEPALTATLRVFVRGSDGAALPGATVHLESQVPQCIDPASQTTDAEGGAALRAGAGAHAVVVDAPGHRQLYESVQLGPTDSLRLNVLLEAE